MPMAMTATMTVAAFSGISRTFIPPTIISMGTTLGTSAMIPPLIEVNISDITTNTTASSPPSAAACPSSSRSAAALIMRFSPTTTVAMSAPA